MKAHIGVDSKEGIVHSVCSTAASVSDVHMLPELLHGSEKKVWGDAGYQGQSAAIHEAAPRALYDLAPCKDQTGVDEREKRKIHTKARVRAKVEWPFRIVKRVFGFTKVRYRGFEESRVAVRGLCAGQPLQESQTVGEDRPTVGPARGVVCPLRRPRRPPQREKSTEGIQSMR